MNLEGLGLGRKLDEYTTLLIPGQITDMSWDEKRFMCKATTTDGITVNKTIALWVKGHYLKLFVDSNNYCARNVKIFFFLHILEVEHTVDITASEDTPTAGEKLTLTCSVRSKVPAMVKWVTENGDPVLNTSDVIVSPQRMDFLIPTVNISFEPLNTSHAGIYMCISNNSLSIIEEEYVVAIAGEYLLCFFTKLFC